MRVPVVGKPRAGDEPWQCPVEDIRSANGVVRGQSPRARAPTEGETRHEVPRSSRRWRRAAIVCAAAAVLWSGCAGPTSSDEWGDPSDVVFSFWDKTGDVYRDGQPYSGRGAAGVDIVAVRAHDGNGWLEIHLALTNLSVLDSELGHPNYVVQYAVGFRIAGDDLYEFRGTLYGDERADPPKGDWAFQLYDQTGDEWPGITGRVQGSMLQWKIPHYMVTAEPGDRLTDWHVNTWASMDDGKQYWDRAATDDDFVLL